MKTFHHFVSNGLKKIYAKNNINKCCYIQCTYFLPPFKPFPFKAQIMENI